MRLRRAHDQAGRRRTLRDRLTGRTPRSERGDRGSIPCPGLSAGSRSPSGDREPRESKSLACTVDLLTAEARFRMKQELIQVAESQTRGVENAVGNAHEVRVPPWRSRRPTIA
jgi:hypothetical protein